MHSMSFPASSSISLLLPLIFAAMVFILDPVASHRRGHGHHQHHHGPPLPFLDNLDRSAVQEFFNISQSEVPKGEVKAKLLAWAQQNRVESELKKYVQKQEEAAKKIYDTAVGNLSGQALELFNKVWQINQDDGLTARQDCQQIGAAFSAAQQSSPLVRDIVVSLLPPKPLPTMPRGCGPFPGGRKGGCGGGGRHGGRGRHGHHGGGGGGGGGRRRGGKGRSSNSGGSSNEAEGDGGATAQQQQQLAMEQENMAEDSS